MGCDFSQMLLDLLLIDMGSIMAHATSSVFAGSPYWSLELGRKNQIFSLSLKDMRSYFCCQLAVNKSVLSVMYLKNNWHFECINWPFYLERKITPKEVFLLVHPTLYRQ